MKRLINLLSLTLFIGITQLNAQAFKPYLILGSNITDDYLTESGNSQVLTRMGPNMGIGVSSKINQRFQADMEMLFSQNGFYSAFVQIPTVSLDKIVTRYIEVPLNLTYRFNINNTPQKHFYKTNVSFGIAYAHLFDYKIIAIDGTDLTNDIRFQQEDILLFNAGATYFFTNSLALNGRGTLSSVGGWTIAIRLLYYFTQN